MIRGRMRTLFFRTTSLWAIWPSGGGVMSDVALRLAADTTHTYFIAAEEIDWDYAPSGRDLMRGTTFGPEAETFVARGPGRIGSVYRKAVYRRYTDASFTQRAAVPPEWQHKGILGPILRAEVGDTIRVVFRNLASRAYSIHPHGVFYTKASEGTPGSDGTSGAARRDDSVPPGGTHTYVWPVPERAGPGPADPSSLVWMYHSHVNEPRDTNAGLIGAIIVTRRDMAGPDGRPLDVDREFVSLFKVFDENQSWYLDRNAGARAVDVDPGDWEDEGFVESNLMHGINGFVFGNLPLMTMREGERVRWYLLDLGSELDLHTAHWHGSTVTLSGHRADIVELLPGSTKVADMIPDNPGTWMYHCHVDDHISGGMTGRYLVLLGSRRR